MPLQNAQDCQNANTVFNELHRTYGQQRVWTFAEFVFRPPSASWLNGARPPYDVIMKLPPTNNATGVIYIRGTSVNAGGHVETAVGTIPNH